MASLLIHAVQFIYKIRYSELSSTTIIVYDHLITIDEEWEYVWRAPWTVAKCLFLFNRYYTVFVVIFNNYALFSPRITDNLYVNTGDVGCFRWFNWQGWTGLLACAIAEIILMLRLYALYFRSKKMLTLLVVSFVSAMAASATIMGMVLNEFTAHAHMIPGLPFCVPQGVSDHFYAFWIPILALETLLCALALARGVRSYRQSSRGSNARGVQLLEVLLRDSVLYYVVMFATYVTITMIWVFGSLFMLEVPIGFAVAMSCVMGNRLLLNLRKSAAQQREPHLSQHRDSRYPSQKYNTAASAQGTEAQIATLSVGKDLETFSGETYAAPVEQHAEGGIGSIEMQTLRSLRSERNRH